MSSRQCLPIDEDTSSDSELNFNLEEISALKYLKQVRSERKKLPKIVSIDIPEKYRDAEEPKSQEANQEKFNQTKEWQNIQKSTFERLQKTIIEIRESGEYEDKIIDCLPVNLNDPIECINYCKDNEPKLSFMLALDQGRLENLIEQLANYLEEHIEDSANDLNWITKWIYSSLACLHIPLDPEVHSSIRMIAKSCIQLINHSNEITDCKKPDEYLPQKLLITIIANNFHQFDLLSL